MSERYETSPPRDFARKFIREIQGLGSCQNGEFPQKLYEFIYGNDEYKRLMEIHERVSSCLCDNKCLLQALNDLGFTWVEITRWYFLRNPLSLIYPKIRSFIEKNQGVVSPQQ